MKTPTATLGSMGPPQKKARTNGSLGDFVRIPVPAVATGLHQLAASPSPVAASVQSAIITPGHVVQVGTALPCPQVSCPQRRLRTPRPPCLPSRPTRKEYVRSGASEKGHAENQGLFPP